MSRDLAETLGPVIIEDLEDGKGLVNEIKRWYVIMVWKKWRFVLRNEE